MESIASPDNNNDVISRKMNLKHVVKCCQILFSLILDLHSDLNMKNNFLKRSNFEVMTFEKWEEMHVFLSNWVKTFLAG